MQVAANWPQADNRANQLTGRLVKQKGAGQGRQVWFLIAVWCSLPSHCPAPAYYIIARAQSRGRPSTGWAGVGHFIVRPFMVHKVHKAWCLAGNLVYNQTTRWRRCSYLVCKQNTRGQRCSYWTTPHVPQRLIYGSCPRFAPKTVDAPINPMRHIGRKLRYPFSKIDNYLIYICILKFIMTIWSK